MMLQNLLPNGLTSLDWPDTSADVMNDAQGAYIGRHKRSAALPCHKTIPLNDQEHHEAVFRDYVPSAYRNER